MYTVKYIAIILGTYVLVSWITGCVVQNNYLHRDQVIAACKECEQADMRPNVIYVRTAYRGSQVQYPVDVQCEPIIRKSR